MLGSGNNGGGNSAGCIAVRWDMPRALSTFAFRVITFRTGTTR